MFTRKLTIFSLIMLILLVGSQFALIGHEHHHDCATTGPSGATSDSPLTHLFVWTSLFCSVVDSSLVLFSMMIFLSYLSVGLALRGITIISDREPFMSRRSTIEFRNFVLNPFRGLALAMSDGVVNPKIFA
ncbi:MAG: hypothetical protein UW46_C0005G0038 [Candidatus Yanofskybacteria bacterium GW2011_GWF1_44_227]|uniref:Uncharacterized protein n=1 Tax=Candidatus Yanofskybacteria bacterium GW2011_GWE2_40_11 TaxID=1619033 RepID=A0A0G0QUG2_9BACT|nr:MAG: hypothetical protein UT69_C0010G0004 [Candidatus Yanofskybacteria bacterium GW2011_GWE1_40_10]KKR41001.1 MAG: hypothetical protein UT75_C0002G0038 [Candidatus Yanofskybacteria bacterium GW2011_GWE2_40_11]KKT15518.1 MAG: hypothetical protein UV97_C0005G0011 [Candidatus Yanofskybacteria bacterium GW2011_GWF2_43_596]KKT53232.1 MAG: hypothetical protein UW46_C0005G0038 [Candidatus Yanofskybacteria bacterium GW2011_GWF1_44_227]OGN35560.1 MAG: hypothetical protein A2207_02355 [Candidatus Yano